MSTIKISGTGCSLGDIVYNRIDFSSPVFKKYRYKKTGDGGLSPGRLVFTEEFEKFAGAHYSDVMKEITEGKKPDTFNLGGPGIVATIHASQMLHEYNAEVYFYGAVGKDDLGEKILAIVKKTPVSIDKYRLFSSNSPFTDVLSDPDFDHGKGERIFVNSIGCAWDLLPEHLDDDFFNSDIVVFGGTALVPIIHDNLSALLQKSKKNGCTTVVNTVFDFRNERKNPGKPWPLGKNEDLSNIDLLIMDYEEALKISGMKDIHKALQYFMNHNAATIVITHGTHPVKIFSSGRMFKPCDYHEMPVSQTVEEELIKNPNFKGDTTGCGDNFAGGFISSLAMQLQSGSAGNLDIKEACALAIASGGFACYYMGGTYLEKEKGEKFRKIDRLVKEYKIS